MFLVGLLHGRYIRRTPGPDHFHKSVQGGVEAFGQHVWANLFQAFCEDSEPRIVVAGIVLTIGQATAFADVLRMFADTAHGPLCAAAVRA